MAGTWVIPHTQPPPGAALCAWQVDCLESTLEKSLQAKCPSDLKVSILLDFMRGSRGGCGLFLLPSRCPHLHAGGAVRTV